MEMRIEAEVEEAMLLAPAWVLLQADLGLGNRPVDTSVDRDVDRAVLVHAELQTADYSGPLSATSISYCINICFNPWGKGYQIGRAHV